ncbi:MAG: hypothetical protein K1X94_24690 [Sandaracinaceae bacterium]|nr:hypothetical protein [Sandaracinaceae bacterium]
MGLLSTWSARQLAESLRQGANQASGGQDPEPPDGHDPSDHSRLAWCEICQRSEYRGRWVALDECRYDDQGRAAEGSVVDADEDLVELCSRMRASDRKNCAILFADED